MLMTRIAIAIIVLLVCGASKASPLTLLVNGDFETPVVVGLDDEFDAPSSAITGWSVTGGSVDINTSGSTVLDAVSEPS
jgi:hypothetical protein